MRHFRIVHECCCTYYCQKVGAKTLPFHENLQFVHANDEENQSELLFINICVKSLASFIFVLDCCPICRMYKIIIKIYDLCHTKEE